MTNHHYNGYSIGASADMVESFMPSIRMMLLTAFCLSIRQADASTPTETLPRGDYTFEALKERIMNGPSALSMLDKIVYFAVLAIAFEGFNQIAVHLGGALYH